MKTRFDAVLISIAVTSDLAIAWLNDARIGIIATNVEE